MPLNLRLGPMVGVSAIAISVAGNPVSGWTAGGGGGMSPNASLTIVKEATDATIVAPHAQWFGVSSLTGFTPAGPASSGEVHDPSAHDITYVWDFGDTGAAPNAACNLPTVWRDTNLAYGKRVSHVFANPGTFTITCWAFDNDGHWSQSTTTVTVADPAATFPGTRTICVNPVGDSNFAGAPAGAQQVNGLAAIQPAIASLGTVTHRVLFKRGATYVDTVFPSYPSNTRNAYFAAYGTGARPLLRPPATLNGAMASIRGDAGTDGNKFVGLEFQGNWDVTRQNGIGYATFLDTFFNNSTLLIHDCRVRDFDGQTIGGPETHKVDVVVSNTLIENWRGFAIFLQGGERADTRFAFVGSAMHMSPNAMQGSFNGFFDGLVGNLNGPFRNGHATQVFWSCSSAFSNTGWSPPNMYLRSAANVPAQSIQVPLRGNSDQGGFYSASIPILWNIERSVFEGGGCINLAGSGYPGNYILDKVICLGSAQTTDTLLGMTGGATVRNVFFWHPNAQMTHGTADCFIQANAGPNQAGNAGRPVRIHNCTAYSARISANFSSVEAIEPVNYAVLASARGGVAYTDIVIENNIVHAPAQNVPLVASAPVQMVAIPGLTTLYRGPRWDFPVIAVTLGANVPNGGTVNFPYPDDRATHPNGVITNQAHFIANPTTGRHMLTGTDASDGAPLQGKPIAAAAGAFTVTFGASNIVVTNTSGITWSSGRTIKLLLDRANEVSPPLAQYASPATVEVPVPIAGSPALNAAGVGRRSWDDLFGTLRVGSISRTGVVQAGTGPDRGAVEVVA